MGKRTTIMADPELLLEARSFAKDQGTTFTALVHDALREYLENHSRPRELPDWVGAFSSGESWGVEEQNRQLVEGLDPIEGWSPNRADLAADARVDRSEARTG